MQMKCNEIFWERSTVWAGAGFENYNLLVEIQNTKSQSGHGLLDKAAYL